MKQVRNLRVNRKTFNRNKRRYKIVTKVLAVALSGSLIAGGITYVATAEQRQIDTIVEYYGEKSIEKKILDYIDISEKLNDLRLDNYITLESEFSKYKISTKLKTVDEINELIDRLKQSDIDQYDASAQKENIELILTLKKQEDLVNGYIYDTGYYIAHSDITTATKKYAAEVFGIDRYSSIKFNYRGESTSGDETIYINNTVEKESYAMDNLFRTGKENKIRDGVIDMINTDTNDDHDMTDNNEYNDLRNKYIKDALEQSVLLETKVENKDLYDRNLAGKMK